MRASAFRPRRMLGGEAGGARVGQVFKPVRASPGGVAGVPGGASHRCGFVAGRPMRAWHSRVPLSVVESCRVMLGATEFYCYLGLSGNRVHLKGLYFTT